MKDTTKLNLHKIFEKMHKNKSKAIEELYTNYRDLVYGIAFSILKKPEDSEDIVQKVFLKIWKISSQNIPTKNEASWLYCFTKNETLNLLREIKKHDNLESIYEIDDPQYFINDLLDNDAYNTIVSRLSQKDQEIIALKILSNFSFKEISQILNMPIGTVHRML